MALARDASSRRDFGGCPFGRAAKQGRETPLQSDCEAGNVTARQLACRSLPCLQGHHACGLVHSAGTHDLHQALLGPNHRGFGKLDYAAFHSCHLNHLTQTLKGHTMNILDSQHVYLSVHP